MYPFMYGFNMTYLLFSLPALLFGLWAQAKVKSAFNKYSKSQDLYWCNRGVRLPGIYLMITVFRMFGSNQPMDF